MADENKTPEGELKGAVAEAFTEATGLSPAQFKEKMAELDSFNKRQAEIDRKDAEENARSKMPNAYAARAAHIIKSDPKGGAGLRWARYVRACALAAKQHVDARVIAKELWQDSQLADEIDQMRSKALAAGTFSAGGALVPDQFDSEVIELLRSASVIRAAGPRIMPMRNGTLTIPRQTAAATAAYTGENSNATSSQQSFGQIQLTARKLIALTPVSNDLLREADPSVDQLVRDDLVRVMALKEDISFLRADGTLNEPLGIRHQTLAGNIFDITHSGATATAAEALLDLTDCIRRVRAANVSLVRPAWFMSTRSLYFLMNQRDNAGWVFPSLQNPNPTLLGFPVFQTNQLPETLNVSGSGGNDETEVYFCEMSEVLIGDAMAMEVEVVPFGAYYNGSTVISGISQDQTVVMTISKHDIALRHEEGASILTAVDWAP